MKRIMKIMLSMGMLVGIICCVPVKAEGDETDSNTTEYVVFDLDGGDQSETIYDENGNPVVISMTSIDGQQKATIIGDFG